MRFEATGVEDMRRCERLLSFVGGNKGRMRELGISESV